MNCTVKSFKKCIPIFYLFFILFLKYQLLPPPHRNVNFPILLKYDSTLCSQVCWKTGLPTPFYTPHVQMPPWFSSWSCSGPRQFWVGPYSAHQELNSVCLFVQTWDMAHLGLPGTCSPIMEGQLTKAVHQVIVISRDAGLIFIFVYEMWSKIRWEAQ